jgi:hypothetical protein
VARFLSKEWFDELRAGSQDSEERRADMPGRAGVSGWAGSDVAAGKAPGAGAPGGRSGGGELPFGAVTEAPVRPELVVDPQLVVDVVVSGAPEGEVRYQLVVYGKRARIVSDESGFWPAQVELSSDYATMAGLASGNLSALDALSAGRARLSGDIAALSMRQPVLGGLDLLPPPVRAGTTF